MNEPWKKENIGEFFKRHLAEFRQQNTTPYGGEKEMEYQAFHAAYPIEKFNRWIIGDMKGPNDEEERKNNPGYFREFASKFPLGLR